MSRPDYTHDRLHSQSATLVYFYPRRINRASGPYQMIGELGDGIVFRCNSTTGEVSAEYIEEVPAPHFHEKYPPPFKGVP